MQAENRSLTTWIKCFLLCIVLVLPARCYNGYYLHALEIDSNISVQYLNLVDLALVIVTLFFVIGQRNLLVDKRAFRPVFIYISANMIMAIFLTFFANGETIAELISKSSIVFCAGIIASQLQDYSDSQKSSIYLVSIGILIVASFFLSGYAGYAVMNRVGSLGFGTNETASFACCFLAIVLFVKELNIWIRLGGTILSIACVLNVASRRGMVVSALIIAAWIILLVVYNKPRKVKFRSFLLAIAIGIGVVVVVYAKFQDIVDYVSNSALLVRYRFTVRYNEKFIDYSDRLDIYKNAVQYFEDHFLLGSYGCDTFFAKGTYSHAHNILLQMIVTNGVFFGTLYIVFFLISIYRSIIILIAYLAGKAAPFSGIVSLFFLVDMIFEFFGYMLWNPKGLFLIVLTMLLLDFEYQKVIISRKIPD